MTDITASKAELTVHIPFVELEQILECDEVLPLRITNQKKMLEWISKKLADGNFFKLWMFEAYETGEAWLEGAN